MGIFWLIVAPIGVLVGLALAPFLQSYVTDMTSNMLATMPAVAVQLVGTPLLPIINLLPFAFIGLIIVAAIWGILGSMQN